MINKTLKPLTLALIIGLSSCVNKIDNQRVSIIPQPVNIKASSGDFIITQSTKLVVNTPKLAHLATYSSTLWEQYLGYRISQATDGDESTGNNIYLNINKETNPQIGKEGYTLEISNDEITIAANTNAGIFYGIQTLQQLVSTNTDGKIPSLRITDFPRFEYRGMHLDVSRHFHPVEFIYQLLDHMAMHKLNTFHWHLIDDQGWRLEIKKHPKLTEIGAWRADMSNRHWNDRPIADAKGKPATYGGFYTQEQVKNVVAYAAERNITVMPEIEMPAHVMSALAAYPELSCTGENLGVPPGGVWPITHIYCAGNEETFKFIEEVLAEVMELFPSEFIHIGGDEAFKTEWEKCPKCQQRIKDEGLKDENELQSYFIKRIEKFLNEHDRTIVGWDEILEGGLAPNAVVMSWRGEEGGIHAAKMGNRAIMTPGSHCYFDHYQGDPSREPLAIGGYTTLKKVYNYEPIPDTLNAEEGKLILGAQANLWTEYMPTTQQVEYMVFPRLAALSEVVWSPKTSRNWGDFSQRMEHQYDRYKRLGINYSQSAFQVQIKPTINPEKEALSIELQTEVYNPEIHFTIDGSEPSTNSPKYQNPISLTESATLKAAVFSNGNMLGSASQSQYNLHKAFAKSISQEFTNNKNYNGGGDYALVDGIKGSISSSDGTWKGYLGKDLVATIDLGKPTSIQKISVDALQDNVSWIFFPTKAVFEVSSDGKQFQTIQEVNNTISTNQGGKIIKVFEAKKELNGIQKVRVTLKNLGECPKGHSGEGKPAFLFVSEIVVE